MTFFSRCWQLSPWVVIVACHSTNSSSGAATTSASAPVTAVSAPAVTASATSSARPAPSAGSRVVLSPEERQRENRYQAALARGRRATVSKDYAAAEQAFTEALKEHPGDARALGERGYARLLDSRLDDATADFRDAEKGSAPPELAAQIYYNQGLVAERTGNLETAKIAFARSQAAHATASAAKKLAALHGDSCTMEVDRVDQAAEHFASWLELWKSIGDGSTLTSEDAIKEALNVTECKTHCIAGQEQWHLVLPTATGLDMIRALDEGGYSRCAAPPQFGFNEQGNILQVHSMRTTLTMAVPDSCTADNCVAYCTDGPAHASDTFVDLMTRRAILHISQYGPLSEKFEPSSVELKDGAVSITGNGCDRTLALTQK